MKLAEPIRGFHHYHSIW